MTKRFRHIRRREEGGLSLEATLVLPFFLAFIIALQTVLQLVHIQIALRSAVFQTVELTATHLYPVQLLYLEAKTQIEGTRAAAVLGQVLDKLEAAHGKVTGVEDGLLQASAYVPAPVLELVRWEKEKREQVEQAGLNKVEKVKQETFDKAVNKAFTEVVYQLTDGRTLRKERFRVIHVQLPNLEQREDAYFTIEAEYVAVLPIPFVHPKIVLRAQSTELAWLQ